MIQLYGKLFIFASFKFNRGHDVVPQGGNFYATNFREIMLLQHRVGSLDNTPKAFPRLKPEQRVVLHIFIVQISIVMKTTNIRKKDVYDDKPYGYIANFVKTEWGYLPNIK